MPVEPSYLASEERSALQDLHGVVWNTDDTFDEDDPEAFEIMEFHRRSGSGGHWYLPHHETLKYERFATELQAYEAAVALDRKFN